MKNIELLHNQAMELSDLAFLAKKKGDLGKFEDISLQALSLEVDAANGLRDQFHAEPTRSILYRSAASIAIDCGQFRQAEILISTALMGEPPDEIAEELRDLLEQVNFRRHLDLRGIEINSNEIQLSIAGKAIGFGVARGEEIVGRIQSIQTIFHRTIERMLNRPYRKGGSFDASIGGVFVSAPRSGSFAVSISVGLSRQSEQKDLFEDANNSPGFTNDESGVVDEVLTCLSLLNEVKEEELLQRIRSADYFENFLELGYELAPNGEDVSIVGITTMKGEEENRLEFRRTRRDISLAMRDWKARMRGERVKIRGYLRLADTVKNNYDGRVVLIDDDKKRYTILALQKDISEKIMPLWSSYVEVTGTYNADGYIVFENILPSKQTQDKR